MFRRVRDSFASTPQAPRMQPLPLPEIRSPSPISRPSIGVMSPKASPIVPMTPKPLKGHRRSPSSQDSGYSTSPEASTSFNKRARAPSDAARSPVAPPLKSILKQRSPPVVVRATLIQQERDGYTSSPEKPTKFSSSRNRGEPSRPRAATTGSFTPPVTLHWKLLPYNPEISKGRLIFDLTKNVDDIRLAPTTARSSLSPRPLTSTERNKPAAEPPLQSMVIRCNDLPSWTVHVEREEGVRCVDIFTSIQETFDVVLTRHDRDAYSHHLRECQAAFEARMRRTPGRESVKGMRRVDLLKNRTMFTGLDWVPPDDKHPDGSWALKLTTSYS